MYIVSLGYPWIADPDGSLMRRRVRLLRRYMGAGFVWAVTGENEKGDSVIVVATRTYSGSRYALRSLSMIGRYRLFLQGSYRAVPHRVAPMPTRM